MIEVRNVNTGNHDIIPEDWLGDEVLDGGKWERVVAAPPEIAAERPTEKSSHEEIDAFAASIDGFQFPDDAKTKAQKIAALDELAPSREPDGTAPVFPESDPGVQLVAGDVDTQSTIPMYRSDYVDPITTTDGNGSSDGTPAAGDEEN